MPGIPQVFLLRPATMLMPIIGSTSPTSPMPNNGPYIVQLSLFACLIIVSLFLILLGLSVSFAFFYTRITGPIYSQRELAWVIYSQQELVWVMRHQKWLDNAMPVPIMRPQSYRNKRNRRHRYRRRHYIDQSLSSSHQQGYSDSTKALSRLQPRDQATQWNDGSVYQLQRSTEPTPSAPSAKPSVSAVSSSLANPSVSAVSSSLAKSSLSAVPSPLAVPSRLAKPSFSSEP